MLYFRQITINCVKKRLKCGYFFKAEFPLENGFLVLSGPNLNLLGQREPALYGTVTLNDIHQQLTQMAQNAGVLLECFQSNSESALIERIHLAFTRKTKGIVLNPAAFTHTSIALRDALLAVNIPFVEVHLSNVYAREAFRKHSYFSDIALGVISGLGAKGYGFALEYLLQQQA